MHFVKICIYYWIIFFYLKSNKKFKGNRPIHFTDVRSKVKPHPDICKIFLWRLRLSIFLAITPRVNNISGGIYSLTLIPNDRFFEKIFHSSSIYSQSFCQQSAERKLPKKYFSFFNFLMTDLGYESRLLSLISRYRSQRFRRLNIHNILLRKVLISFNNK